MITFFRKKIVKRGDIDNIKRQQRLLAQPLQDFDSVIIIFAETEDMQRHVPVVHLKLNVSNFKCVYSKQKVVWHLFFHNYQP